LKAAVAEAKAGKDVERYRDAVDALRRVSLSDPETELDKAWIEKTSSANKKETQHLESQLKVYRSNLVKESVRVSYFVHRVIVIHYVGRRQGGILTVTLFF